ncbi:MAG: hypothetical protein RLZZ416_173 [Candidatus Parcubacteria bacterium]|jgi:signal transduction histidine kinase
MAGGYLKRFGELATVWLRRYHEDPFFRTEVNVIALQIAFAIAIIGLIGASFSLINRDVANAILAGMQTSAKSSPATLSVNIVEEIQNIRTQSLGGVIFAVAFMTLLFSYLIARVTLAPARSALTSQKQFIGNIAHELRTPLSVIKTNTEVALLEKNADAEVRKTLESNVEELDRISEIINNLLSLSALVRPERVEFGVVDLSKVVDESMAKFSRLAKRGEQEITVRKSPGTDVWGNGTALVQIVGNLLKNAIQYSRRGGHIGITLEQAPENMVQLTIQDSGIGIARQDLFRIFEPFYRADPSRTRGHGGSGLGLTIVSELVKMHRGRISIRSAIGRGTTVTVLLPGVDGHLENKGTETKNTLNEIQVDFSAR